MFDWASLIAALIGAAAGGFGSFWATRQAARQSIAEDRKEAVSDLHTHYLALANLAAQHPFQDDPLATVHKDVVAATQDVLLSITHVAATVKGKSDPLTPWLTAAMYQIASAPSGKDAVLRAMLANGRVQKWQIGRLPTKWFATNPVTTDDLGPLVLSGDD